MELDEVRRLRSELKYCENEPVAGDIVLELCDMVLELAEEKGRMTNGRKGTD